MSVKCSQLQIPRDRATSVPPCPGQLTVLTRPPHGWGLGWGLNSVEQRADHIAGFEDRPQGHKVWRCFAGQYEAALKSVNYLGIDCPAAAFRSPRQTGLEVAGKTDAHLRIGSAHKIMYHGGVDFSK